MPTEAQNQEEPKPGTPPADGNGGKQKITFTEEQIPKVNELVNDAYSRAYSKARTEVTEKDTTIQQLQSELAEAKKTTARAKPDDKDGAQDEVARIRAELIEAKRVGTNTEAELRRRDEQVAAERRNTEEAKAEAVRIRKEAAIRNAASRVGFIDQDDVVRLTQDVIKWDPEKNRHVVLNENGQPRMNNAYEPMSVDEFYQEYATSKKYLVKSDVLFGSGSSESSRAGLSNDGKYALTDLFGAKANAALANKVAMTNYPEYKRLKKLAIEQRIIPG